MSMMFVFNLANAMVQNAVRDDFRGRVMGIYSLTIFGIIPIGSLAGGVVADAIGAPLLIIGSSAVLFVFSLALYIFQHRIFDTI
jgi:predicted MFS family arabinose efflux permease